MIKVRPKSLSSLMLLGLAVIAVPLLVAILNAALQMRRLADASRELVVEGVITARSSQDLKSEIGSLDRTAHMYRILADPKLLDLYREQSAELSATRRHLAERLTSPEARSALARLGALQRRLDSLITAPPRPAEPASSRSSGPPAKSQSSGPAAADPATLSLPHLTRRFRELAAIANRVAALSTAQIDTEVAGIRHRTRAAQRRLFWQSTLLLPLTISLILIVTLAIGRPLRQIDRVITELGAGRYAQPISVTGPTDLEQLGRQLEWLRGRLLDHAQERSRFLRHMSHELKTPLANIREGTELLLDGAVGDLDADQREVAGILRENSLKLQRMIENLLSFSAWQTSSVGLEVSELRLRPLVKQVLENQQLTLLSQRARLDVRIEDVTLVADRGKLRLILDNLLSNAIKYSPKGGTIHMRAHTQGGELILDVADSGPGIAHDERVHVFDAFYTGRAAKAANVKGTGIGLSVVQEFVSAHGGSVRIVDGEYPGAHFRITLPLGRPDGEAARPRDEAHAA